MHFLDLMGEADGLEKERERLAEEQAKREKEIAAKKDHEGTNVFVIF